MCHKTAEESDTMGSNYAPNYTPDDSGVHRGISKGDQQHPPRSRLGSDLETGKPLGPRDQFALIRSSASEFAMGSRARRRGQFKKAIKKVTFRHDEDEDEPPLKRERMKWRNQTDVDASINKTFRGRLMIEACHDDEERGKEKGIQYRLTTYSVRRAVSTFVSVLASSKLIFLSCNHIT
jgi:hypothetical protein